MGNPLSISVVLPAFNEERNLASAINAAIAALHRIGAVFEIVIVDDGSTDGTPEVCRELRAGHSSIRVIRHEHNRGYGAALRVGFDAAQCDLIFFTDADGQFSFEQLSEFLRKIDNCDAVIGYRIARQDLWHRKLNSRVGNWFARTILSLRVKDINCAYKLLRRESLRKLPLRCDGAMINTELLALGYWAGWKIIELPVAHFPRRFGKATGAKPAVILRTMVEFVATYRKIDNYSARSASTGLTRLARRAGSRQASNAAAPRIASVPLSRNGLKADV
jgi:glycosyltransferase involved in cell wall biosynthesis